MIAALRRKLGQVLADPALRRFLVERALGRVAPPPPFVAGRPPYLSAADFALGPPPAATWAEQPAAPATGPLVLALPGAEIVVERADAAFDHACADLETHLGLHRFCWLPVMGDAAPAGWVAALWQAWMDRFATPDGSWAWHPYTAAERAVNILAHARRHGMPGPAERSLAVLAAHVPAIAAQLEYSGEHHTGNHLSNNGRGLFLLGLALGWQRAADLGARILTAEAARLFAPSGMLREGSSHYHLLVARNYLSCWLAADGWVRVDRGDFATLWHAAPQGWPFMPGHGHHDLGGFELHWRGLPLFVDPGRGAYGEGGEAARYRSAGVHSTLQLDDGDPTPANRPYYDDAFRRRVGGAPPRLDATDNAVRLVHHGFGARVERRMVLDEGGVTLFDAVEGGGGRRIVRRLVTPWPVEAADRRATVRTPAGAVVVEADAPMRTVALTRWTAYGCGRPAVALETETVAAGGVWKGTLAVMAKA